MKSPIDISALVTQIDRAKSLGLRCQDAAERMRYATIKSAFECELARAMGLKDFGLVPRTRKESRHDKQTQSVKATQSL